MKIRFAVNQAECFRRGIDAPRSIVTIEVDPATLPQKERNLLADRLEGINVVAQGASEAHQLVMALTPDFEGLMAAIALDRHPLFRDQTQTA